jgi:hypothetical protein
MAMARGDLAAYPLLAAAATVGRELSVADGSPDADDPALHPAAAVNVAMATAAARAFRGTRRGVAKGTS